MANSIRQDFHTDIVSLVATDIQYQRSNYYYYLGKVDSWGNDDDKAPTILDIDSDYNNSLIRSNIIYVKKIIPNDISVVAKRTDWSSGVVYTSWDSKKDMRGLPFFVVTNDNNVYKCLDNNGGGVSTVKPSGKSLYVIRSADGYIWKYMYSIPVFKQTKFTSLDYVPVQKSLSDSFYNKGSIDAVSVMAGGSGYLDAPLTYITTGSGTTTGSGATGTITVGITGNITGVTITNGGSGYTKGVRFSIVSVAGSGAIGVPVIVAGVVTGVTIEDAGVGYSNSDNVVFSVGGAVIFPSVSRVSGGITKLNVIDQGIGYNTPPTLTVVGSGTGKYGNLTALVNCVVYNGSVTIANIIDPGIDYSADNDTSISVAGDGENAIFSPVIFNGSVVDVIVENPGSGYTAVELTITGSGTGAIISPIITASDFISDQSIVEQITTPDEIYSIQITTPGTNYSNTTVCTVTGDGTGCIANPVIVNGQIVSVKVTDFGHGYSYANISFSDINRNFSIDNIDAVAYAIIPPVNGHGYDAVAELYGNTLAINTSLRADAILNRIQQDYRQFGIIKNPKDVLSGANFTESFSLVAYTVTLNNVTGLTIDEILIKDGIKYRVVFIDSMNVTIQQVGTKTVSPSGTLYAESNQGRTYTVQNIISYPKLNKFSGKLLYVSEENAFSFTEEQGIIIKTFITM